MAYRLGIDIGTTYTAAAIVENGQASIVALGDRAPVVPTVVFLREDDQILTGDTANRRAASDPGRVARQFKRRVGDTTPLLLGGSPMSAQALMGRMLRWTLDHVIQLQGGPPDHVTVSHPANWGAYKLDLLGQAIRMAEMGETSIISEPEAAAIYYASTQRVDPGETIAVYDLGGGTFDAAVLRKTEDGFTILGSPEGIEHLGGIDIDEAVYAHVASALGGALDGLDADDPLVQAGVARLRSDCVEAKEALSTDSSASIPVLLSNVQAEVRITRDELERMVRPWLTDTIAALRRALRSAGVEPEGIKTVLLVGGTSRIPLVAQMVSESLGRPVSVDAHPKHAVALGAALAAERTVMTRRGAEPAPVVVVAPPEPPTLPAAEPLPVPPPAPAPPGPPDAVPSPPPAPVPVPAAVSSRGNRRWIIPAAAVAVVAVIAGIFVATSGGGGKDKVETGASNSSSSSSSSTGSSSTGLAAVPVGASGRGVMIDAITIKDGKYSVTYRTAGYTPKVDGNDPASHHIHFFFDNLAVENAGANGPNPGQWILYDVPSPFEGFKESDRPATAKRMCAAVSDYLHRVEVDTGNCVNLPGV
jgi:actin-like ATPase involved in cell morphogenesis